MVYRPHHVVRMQWLLIGAAIVAGAAMPLRTGARGDAPSAVTCRVPGDSAERVYRLLRDRETWLLTFQSRETRQQVVRLELPRAAPTVAGDSVTLSYRNANGGRQIDLRAGTETSLLDVWVDYGLEVNIDPDLDPRVDQMNTEGPLAGVRCVVER